MADVRDAARQVGGEIANDGVSSGKPVLVGAFASAATPSAVSTDGDVVNLWADKNGRLQIAVTLLGTTAIDTNSGNKSAGTQRIVIATDQPALTNALLVDPSAVTSPVTPAASASATGLDISRTAALVATATAVKASAGRLYFVHVENPNSVKAYLQIYNTASGSVTVGTTVALITLFIPPGGYDFAWPVPPTFGTAIAIAATTTIGGLTAPSTGLLVNLGYK